jgi:glucan-binding YG repeat protein
MRKQTKLVAVASAAALLAIGASMTSFAATGWVEEDGQWYYYDKDGNKVEDTWKKSGDNWYWLDSEEGGAMAVDKLITDDENTYYVDSNGVMVKNTWVKVVNDDQDEDDEAEYNYYYMQSNGKAYKRSSSASGLTKKVIDGKTYTFDEDGKMLWGWVSSDGDMQNDDETGWADALYYFGSWDDGAMKTGWQRINVYDDEDTKEDDYDYWFNFKSNGQKRSNTNKKKLGGHYYAFDTRGVMIYQWYQTGSATASTAATQSEVGIASASGANVAANWNYFSSPEDGARIVKGWFKVVPPEDDNTFKETEDTFASSDSDDESERWYYADSDGLVAGKIKKIKGKYYGFWPEDTQKSGRMLVGLCALKMNGENIEAVLYSDMDSDDLDDFMNSKGYYMNDRSNSASKTSGNAYTTVDADDNDDTTGVYLYYFGSSSNQDTDGAMKTGSTNITLDGDTYNFYFSKTGGTESRGRGVNGKDGNDYIYMHGQKLKASSDEKYKLVYATGDYGASNSIVWDCDSADVRTVSGIYEAVNKDGDTVKIVDASYFTTDYYLVNTSGKIQKSGSAKKDGDDWYWYVDNYNIKMYTNNKTLSNSRGDSNPIADAYTGTSWKSLTNGTTVNFTIDK